MPNVLNISEIPAISTRTTYRKHFAQALKLPRDKTVEIPVPANKQTYSVYQAAYRSLRRQKLNSKLNVITRSGRVFVIHKGAI